MEKEEIINGSLDFYRIKTEWTRERENGELAKVKTEELVMATSYTEAEKVAYAIVEDQQRAKYGSVNIEIIKTKINDVLFNDILVQDNQTVCGLICNFFEESEESGVGLYNVINNSVVFILKVFHESLFVFIQPIQDSDVFRFVYDFFVYKLADNSRIQLQKFHAFNGFCFLLCSKIHK